jgi:hypothetical protein
MKWRQGGGAAHYDVRVNVWIRKCATFGEDAAADRDFWQGVPPERRVAVVEELRAEWRKIKGEPYERLRRVARVLEPPGR